MKYLHGSPEGTDQQVSSGQEDVLAAKSWSIRRSLTTLSVVVLACCALAGRLTFGQWQRSQTAQTRLNEQLQAKAATDRLAVLNEQIQKSIITVQYVQNAPVAGLSQMIKAAQGEVAKLVEQESAAGLPSAQVSAIQRIGKDISDYVTWMFSQSKANSAADIQARHDTYQAMMAKQAQAVAAAQKLADENAAAKVGETRSVMRSLVWMMAIICMSAAILLPGLLFLFGRQLIRRVAQLGAALRRVAEGDLTVRVAASGRDEVSMMAASVNHALERIGAVFVSIQRVAGSLAEAATGLTDLAVRVGRSAEETSQRAGVVAHGADAVSQNVQSVAAGSEEMGTSISEIARNANEAVQVATGAVRAVESTTDTMSKLGESSRQIGDLVRLITSIAEQTNLLALNATIEAARAGDAGKGFAVVAEEVKQLAQETARATDDISRRVEAIQEDADNAATAIMRINEFQTTIASAVEEQTATTRAINSGVSDAAAGSGDIAENISRVASAAGETASSMADASSGAAALSAMSSELTGLIASFHL